VDKKGKWIEERLKGHAAVSAIRRVGLALGIDLAEPEKRGAFTRAALENGVVVDWYLFRPATFRIAPPLNISLEENEMACQKLTRALDGIR